MRSQGVAIAIIKQSNFCFLFPTPHDIVEYRLPKKIGNLYTKLNGQIEIDNPHQQYPAGYSEYTEIVLALQRAAVGARPRTNDAGV